MKKLLPALGIAAMIAIGVALYVLTLDPSQDDPCIASQNDISAAVLADSSGDSDALANRAIVQRGKCEPSQP